MRANQTVSGFIQLDRTFHELSQAAESDDSDLRPRFGTEHLSWPDLIPEYRVVILSEAGSGKTEEIQYVARSLRLEGKRAFFIRLEHLARELEIAFEEGTVEEFQAWLASGDEGWLLLDSVDEARLRDPRDFEAAVLRLGRILSSSKQRAHIVITGRTTAWRPQTDLALCEKHLPFARSDVSASVEPVESELDEELNTETAPQEREGPFRIVALDDLSARQIEVFARAKGVADTKALLDAVERADAWSFTSRPQDLEELVEFWKDHGRIGSRLHLMQNSIDRRLKERNQDRAEARPLSVERARVGAKLLAAASTMAQEPTIRVPDGTSNMKGLPVAPILPDWNDVDLATLLARPIFDEAIYGTVRFHHRTVREYLTAEWFADLLKRRTSRRRIEQLFFRVQYGLEVIVPTMRPILPWLAILHEGIRDRVRRTAPEVLLEGGDPSQLPLEIRRQILHQVCDQIASGVSKRTMTDYAVVQRFASADLTADIKGLINAHAANDDLLWFLLRMVWQGQLAGALPEAKQIALSRSSSRYPRIAAFRAVAALGSAEDKAEIRRRFLEESRRVDRHWLAELLEDCEPSVETVEWLFKCLSKAGGKDPHNVDYLAQELTAFAREMEHSLLPLFLEQTNGLLARRPVVERRHCEISTRFSWLLRPAGIAVQRLVEARDPAALQLPALAILHKIPIFQQYDGIEFSGLKLVLDELVPQWPDLNFSLFWYLVREERRWCDRKKKERIIDWWRANVAGSYVQFGPKGFHSVLSEIGARPFTDDKLIALSLAFRLYVNGGRPKEWRKLLKKAVGENAVLSTRLSEFMRPPPQSPEMKEHKRREAQWKRRYEKRQQRDQRHHQDWRRYVNEHVDALRNPGLKSPDDISRAQWHLHERMREMDHEPTHWTKGNWEVLKEEYGDSVARAFRDGVVAYWRRHKPTLVSEGAPNNSIPFSTIFGLTGLTIEAREIQEWATTLSEADAELAFRYAMRELNGFPAWFSGLFERFSETVVKMALDEIQYELLGKYKSDQGSYILHDISWRGNWLWDAIAPALCGMVASEEPENVTSLRDLLSIIHGSSVPDDEIALLASDKCASLTRLDHVAHWFASWVGVAPESAIPALERHLVH